LRVRRDYLRSCPDSITVRAESMRPLAFTCRRVPECPSRWFEADGFEAGTRTTSGSFERRDAVGNRGLRKWSLPCPATVLQRIFAIRSSSSRGPGSIGSPIWNGAGRQLRGALFDCDRAQDNHPSSTVGNAVFPEEHPSRSG